MLSDSNSYINICYLIHLMNDSENQTLMYWTSREWKIRFPEEPPLAPNFVQTGSVWYLSRTTVLPCLSSVFNTKKTTCLRSMVVYHYFTGSKILLIKNCTWIHVGDECEIHASPVAWFPATDCCVKYGNSLLSQLLWEWNSTLHMEVYLTRFSELSISRTSALLRVWLLRKRFSFIPLTLIMISIELQLNEL